MARPDYLADAPVCSPADDLLGRATFAQNLAGALLAMPRDTGFVVGLHGAWGTGKSSLINFILHYLAESAGDDVVTVRFNPWWFSGEGDLLVSFLSQFAAALSSSESKKTADEILQSVREYASALSGFSDLAALIPHVGPLLGPLLKHLKREDAKDVNKLRRRVEAALQKTGKRSIVVVDDIDRLTGTEILQTFKVVKAVADFPATTYILAFDPAIVARAVTDLQPGLGSDYIEKIVQLPIELPPLRRTQLGELLVVQLNRLLDDYPAISFDEVRWGNVFIEGISPLLDTPRKVKRCLNRVQALWPAVHKELDAVDFITLQAVGAVAPEFYSLIAASPATFLYPVLDRSTKEEMDAQRGSIESVAGVSGDSVRAPLMSLAKRLFPKVAEMYGDSHYGTSWEANWRKSRRVCSQAMFSQFFGFEVEGGHFSRTEMQAVLAGASDPNALEPIIRGIVDSPGPGGQPSRAREFLAAVIDYLDELEEAELISLLTVLFRLGDEVVARSPRGGGLDVGAVVDLAGLADQCLQRIEPPGRRPEVLVDLFAHADSLHLLVEEVYFRQHDLEEQSSEGLGVTAEQVEQFVGITIAKIEEAAADARLRSKSELGRLLGFWREHAAAECRSFVQAWVASEQGFAEFVTALVQVGHVQVLTDRVGRRVPVLDPQFVGSLVDGPDELELRATAILTAKPEWLEADQAEALQALVERIRDPRHT
jgi:hypothetical protein